jgi:hypothetical protein
MRVIFQEEKVMKNLKWLLVLALMATMLTAVADDAMAQRRGGSSSSSQAPAGYKPYLELSGTYGSMWGGNIDLTYGINSRKIRTGTGPSYGFAIDYNVHPAQAVEFSYTRQDGSLDMDYKGVRTLTPMSVNVWHIGSLRTLAPGPVQPFLLVSLGATYFSPSESSFLFDENDPDSVVYTQTTTKFSFNFGLGIKSYFGDGDKIGLRASFKVMPTLYNTSGGLWFGSGGSGVAVSGNALWQYEAAIGLTVKLGT